MGRSMDDVWQVTKELSGLSPIMVSTLLSQHTKEPSGLRVQIGKSVFLVYPEPNGHIEIWGVNRGEIAQVPKDEAAAYIFLQLV